MLIGSNPINSEYKPKPIRLENNNIYVNIDDIFFFIIRILIVSFQVREFIVIENV